MPSQAVIDDILAQYGWTGMPVDQIVNAAGHGLADVAPKVTLWRTLNANLWNHARAQNWRWIAVAGPNGSQNHVGPLKPGAPPAVVGAGTAGLPLMEGTNLANSCNCGIFNTVARQIAWHVLGFADHELAPAFTTKTFVTRPGSQTFDAAWDGNVRTVANGFATVGAMKFTNHSYSRGPDGTFTDATGNVPTFGHETDLMWFDLRPAKSTIMLAEVTSWLVVDQVYNDAGQLPAGGPPYYLISAEEIRKKRSMFPPGGAGLTQILIDGVTNLCPTNPNWPSWWLLTPADLPDALKQWARYFLPIPGYEPG